MPVDVDLAGIVAEQPHPLVFATVSGAHLYGFPSTDSDVDLRGAHLLAVEDVIGLAQPVETHTVMTDRDGVELDLVTHDLRKFVRLMLRRNGYVLEQLLSPLVVHSSAVHLALVELAPQVLTRHHAHHYRGFAAGQRRLFDTTGELKPLLYAFRALLTGVHLMRTGRMLAHLPSLLLAEGAPAYLPELIAAKRSAEHGGLGDLVAGPVLGRDLDELVARLDQAQQDSRLPEQPAGLTQLDDLVVTARLAESAR
ncbi:nucleotidyltransferase domain-containing protein [Micromonospora violae]|uniref:nucleotidyltransferase domain-containing protein n=1 Tax=Micromonospora violae TaxID=1278207 RepID=UPI001FC9C74B|nr:nucleotidyltransferase domain-containing protein [Micromonospora violae]